MIRHLILVAAGIVLIGCGGGDPANTTVPTVAPTAATEAQAPVYGEPAIVSSDSGMVAVIVEVTNPNANAWMRNGDFTVTLYDAAGAIIETREHETPVPSSASAWIIAEGMAGPARNIDRVEVSTDTEWQTGAYRAPTVTTNAVALDAAGYNLVGEVTNTGEQNAAYVHVAAIFRYATGAIIGGSWTNTKPLAVDDTLVFSGFLYGNSEAMQTGTIEAHAFAVSAS